MMQSAINILLRGNETVKLFTLQTLLKIDRIQPRKVILYLILQGQ